MLAIRLKRLGKKGYPTYRVIVQDSRRSPYSGKVIAQVGNYNPHTKAVNVDKDKIKFYLDNGAQPSPRMLSIFKSEKIKLPSWVEKPTKQKRAVKSPEKLRKNRPADAPAPEKPSADKTEEAKPQAAEPTDEKPGEDKPKEATPQPEPKEPDLSSEASAKGETPKEETKTGQPEAKPEQK